MTNTVTESFLQEEGWLQLRQMVDASALVQVKALVDQHADDFADDFYDRMLADPAMGRFLDHEIVNRRLHASMVRWLRFVFDHESPVAQLQEMQRRTGEVHARIGVPHAAVAQGARVLKRALSARVLADSRLPALSAEAVQYVYELFDLAMDVMGESASADEARLLRSDESYRLFFLSQDLRAERERQKSQLLEWANQILVNNYWDVQQENDGDADPGVNVSQFKLWVEHKALMLFEGVPEAALLRECIDATEAELLPRLKAARDHHASAKEVVSELNAAVERMKGLLGAMFDHAARLEDGRDELTRLLNRRYFPSIVKREIELAQVGGHPFALLLLDLDRFGDIGHALGSDAVDAVIAQIADKLSGSVRAGDFVFRVSECRFLVLLVEANDREAMTVAEELRVRIEHLPLRTPAGVAPQVTVSIGVAFFDGHPDYQQLLDRAERAVREARSFGGNRVERAEPSSPSACPFARSQFPKA